MTCPNSARSRLRQVAFRVTQEQAEAIDRMVALSGMTKQDYIVTRLLDEQVTVVPSTRVVRALRDHCLLVVRELQALDGLCGAEGVPEAVQANLDRLLRFLGGFQGEPGVATNPIRTLKRHR